MKKKISLIILLFSFSPIFSQLSVGGGISSFNSKSIAHISYEAYIDSNFGIQVSAGLPSISAGIVIKTPSNYKSTLGINVDIWEGNFIRYALVKEKELLKNLKLEIGAGISLIAWDIYSERDGIMTLFTEMGSLDVWYFLPGPILSLKYNLTK